MKRKIHTKLTSIVLTPQIPIKQFNNFFHKDAAFVECETGLNGEVILVSYSERDETEEEYNNRILLENKKTKAYLNNKIINLTKDLDKCKKQLKELKDIYR